MNLHIPALVWSIFNIIILIGIILGTAYLIFYIIRKLKKIDKCMDNIERKFNQEDNKKN